MVGGEGLDKGEREFLVLSSLKYEIATCADCPVLIICMSISLKKSVFY